MQAKNDRTQSVRTMFGPTKGVLPLLESAAALMNGLSTSWDLLSTEDLMEQIRAEYRMKLGGRIPRWLVNDCYGEWLAVNSKRLQKMALELADRRAARMFKAHSA